MRRQSIRRVLRPHRLELLMTGTNLAGLVLLVGSLTALDGDPLWGDHPAAYAVFALLLLATELRPMPSLTDDTELTASWAFAFTLLFIAPVAGAVVAVALAPVITDIQQRKSVNRTLFNSSQFALSLAGGGIVGSWISDLSSVSNGEPVTARWLAGVLVACAVGFAMNSLFISVAVALHTGLPVAEMIRRSVGINLGMDGLLLALAPIFVVVGLQSLVLVPLLLITVWIIFKSASLALHNKHEATHDQLTGIPNRRMFEDHAELLIQAADADSEHFALVQIDLDGFKGINDRLGHHYGDEVLREIARRLADGERSSDHAARLGGDEFALLFVNIRSVDEAIAIAERVLQRISEPLDIDGVPLRVGASLGVAVYPDHADDAQRLMHHADIAMYEAKRSGGGVALYEPSAGDPGPGRMSLLADLTKAVGTDQLSLEFQPKVDITTGRITMVEALLRWDHPSRGRVPPSWFMPQAEQTDLISGLTDQVLRIAVTQIRSWRDDGIEMSVAVNVSARNLHDLRFPDRVRAVLAEFDVDGSCIEIEVTENSVTEDPLRSAKVLGRLRELGLSIAVDDFGTGYSSLSTLRDLTIDRVKIDRSFVTDLATQQGDLMIARSVIELAHNLQMNTVAEGVETHEVLEILRELGCDEIQGYLAGRPRPAAELQEVLTNGVVDLDSAGQGAGGARTS